MIVYILAANNLSRAGSSEHLRNIKQSVLATSTYARPVLLEVKKRTKSERKKGQKTRNVNAKIKHDIKISATIKTKGAQKRQN